MAARLRADAGPVVAAFRRQHGCDAPLPGPADAVVLAEDLDRLRHADAREALTRFAGPLHVLAGLDDPLAAPALTVASFPGRAIAMLPGGHLLPLSHPEACAQAVRDMLDRMEA
jgi:pimeloyl-[acyl-carrier protein] methyl ester esterase